jgi:hypothetical protein
MKVEVGVGLRDCCLVSKGITQGNISMDMTSFNVFILVICQSFVYFSKPDMREFQKSQFKGRAILDALIMRWN